MNWKLLRVFIFCVGLAGTMCADTLHYTWNAPGYGTLDGVTFANSSPLNFNVILTMTADSSHVVASGPPGYAPRMFSITGPVTVSVAGVGTDTITDAITIYEQYNSSSTTFGMIDVTSGAGFSIATSKVCSVGCTPTDDLAGAYGLVNGLGFPAAGNFNTTGGSFSFTAPSGPPFTTPGFQITEATSAMTPEPSSLVLLGSGALSLFMVARSRRSRA